MLDHIANSTDSCAQLPRSCWRPSSSSSGSSGTRCGTALAAAAACRLSTRRPTPPRLRWAHFAASYFEHISFCSPPGLQLESCAGYSYMPTASSRTCLSAIQRIRIVELNCSFPHRGAEPGQWRLAASCCHRRLVGCAPCGLRDDCGSIQSRGPSWHARCGDLGFNEYRNAHCDARAQLHRRQHW